MGISLNTIREIIQEKVARSPQRSRVLRNILWNWAGVGTQMVAGFILVRFLIVTMGPTNYGLWILIASLTSYFGLMDLGIRGSVGRYIAFYRARGDHEGVNTLLSTALLILTAVAGVAMLATLAAISVFFHLFKEVPPEQVGAVRLALFLVGLNLAITLPMTVFDGVLWALERFDVMNAVEIPVAVLRVALTFYFIGKGQGLVALSLITLGCSVLMAGSKAIASLWIDPSLRPSIRLWRRDAAVMLYGYGIWQFLLAMAREARGQLAPLLVGVLLKGTALITPYALVTLYSIGARLIGYATQMLSAATGVLTPVATAYCAQDEQERQKQLFVRCGRLATAMAMAVAVLLLVLGRSLIVVWVGPGQAAAYPLLVVLTLGELLPMAQGITNSMIMGTARHRMLAWMGLVETLLAVALSVALVPWAHLMGICIGFAVAAALCRGVFQMVYGCRLMEMPVRAYVQQVMLSPLVAAGVPGVLLAILAYWWPMASWRQVLLLTSAYGVAFAIAMLPMLGIRPRFASPVMQATMVPVE